MASKPLSDYVNVNLGAHKRTVKLKELINKMAHLVGRDIYNAGIAGNFVDKIGDKEITLDVFSNVFRFLDDRQWQHKSFERLIEIVNAGIGVYEERIRIEHRRLYNPLYWISNILRVPLIMIRGAGLVSDDDAGEMFFKIYARIIEVLMLVVIWLVLRKLGFHEAIRHIIGLMSR